MLINQGLVQPSVEKFPPETVGDRYRIPKPVININPLMVCPHQIPSLRV